MKLRCFLLLLGAGSGMVHANAWQGLQQAARAGQSQVFSGQYVRQIDDGLSTFKIWRLRQGQVLAEKRLATDGVARELIKNRQVLHFYTLNSAGLQQARMDGIRLFPAVLPNNVQVLGASYTLKTSEMGRAAGRVCRWYELGAKDPARYSQKLCIDSRTGLPLRQVFHTANGQIVEQIAFSSIDYTAPKPALLQPDQRLSVRDRIMLPPEFNQRNQQRAGVGNQHRVDGLPRGFYVLRHKDGSIQKGVPGHQYVLGDGLITVSLFVEGSADKKKTINKAYQVNGALSMAVRQQNGVKVTLVGDMPPRSLNQMAETLKVSLH